MPKFLRKCFFQHILFLAPFPIEISIATQNFYTHRKNRAREETKTVLKSQWHGEQLGNMAITLGSPLDFKNHRTQTWIPRVLFSPHHFPLVSGTLVFSSFLLVGGRSVINRAYLVKFTQSQAAYLFELAPNFH